MRWTSSSTHTPNGRLAARGATGDPEKSAGRSKILPRRKSGRFARTESEQFRATLLQLSLAADTPSERANALTRLGKLADGKTATSLDALVVLAQNRLSAPVDSSDSTRNEAGRLASALENHPLAKAKHELLAFDLRIHADSTQREQLIARAVGDWKDSDPADRLDLARWLNSKGEYQRAIDSIPLRKHCNRATFFYNTSTRSADLAGGTKSNKKSGAENSRSSRF